MPTAAREQSPKIEAIAFLGLGSSLGDRLRNLETALMGLRERRIGILAVSPIYESPHLGLKPDDAETYPPHLNLAVKIKTLLSPEDLLDAVQAVETEGGRERRERWGPRTIDIDILAYAGTEYASERLVLPHPGIAHRAFVTRPLLDIEPEFRQPDGTRLRDQLDTEPLRSQTIVKTGLSLAEHTRQLADRGHLNLRNSSQ